MNKLIRKPIVESIETEISTATKYPVSDNNHNDENETREDM